jgi:iron complex transport system substrate-binding protein
MRLTRARLLILLLLLPALAPAAQPKRVVSLNLCADQLLMALAPPERIASITWLSRSEGDPALLPLARSLPINHGGAEEVLMARPDLVLAGRYTTSTTRSLLRRAGVPLLELDPAQDWVGIRTLTRTVARALGEERRGEALIADMDLRLAALGRTRPDLPVRVIGWGGSGSDVPGRDTLFNTLLETAGGVNVGVLAPRQGGFDVERVVMTHPQALLRGVSYGATPALRNEAARHRLLRRLYPQGQLTYPEALFGCGVPQAAAAAQALQRSLHDISLAAVRR